MEMGNLCSRKRSPELVRARELVMVLGVEGYGLKVLKLAAALTTSPDGMSHALARGVRRRVYDGGVVDFERVLRLLSGFFEGAALDWGVIGGLAMAVYGSARTTLDVDIVVDSETQDRVIAFLESQGYQTLHRSTGYSNHLHSDPDLGRVDVVYVKGDTSRRVFSEMTVQPGPRGAPIPVPRPEHIAAMKAFSIRNDPRREARELADIEALLHAPDVNRAEIREYLTRYGLEDLLERLKDP
jgi:hypothetical protein